MVIPAIAIAAALPFIMLLSYLAATDVRQLRLPVGANIGLTLTGLAAGGIAFGTPFEDRVAGWLSGLIALQVIAWAYRRVRGREGIGGGDPILLGGIGAWLGWQPLPLIVLIAALMGLAFAVWLRLQGRPRADWSSLRLPLGSLLAAAALLVAVAGHDAATDLTPVGMPDGALTYQPDADVPQDREPTSPALTRDGGEDKQRMGAPARLRLSSEAA